MSTPIPVPAPTMSRPTPVDRAAINRANSLAFGAVGLDVAEGVEASTELV